MNLPSFSSFSSELATFVNVLECYKFVITSKVSYINLPSFSSFFLNMQPLSIFWNVINFQLLQKVLYMNLPSFSSFSSELATFVNVLECYKFVITSKSIIHEFAYFFVFFF